jgi:hypothetical protein
MTALDTDRRLQVTAEEAGTPGIVAGVVSAVVFAGQSAHPPVRPVTGDVLTRLARRRATPTVAHTTSKQHGHRPCSQNTPSTVVDTSRRRRTCKDRQHQSKLTRATRTTAASTASDQHAQPSVTSRNHTGVEATVAPARTARHSNGSREDSTHTMPPSSQKHPRDGHHSTARHQRRACKHHRATRPRTVARNSHNDTQDIATPAPPIDRSACQRAHTSASDDNNTPQRR